MATGHEQDPGGLSRWLVPIAWLVAALCWTVRWVRARWHAIVSPDEVRTAKRIDNYSSASKALAADQLEGERHIEWKIQKYRDLGLSEEQIREKVLVEIDKRPIDPTLVLTRLDSAETRNLPAGRS